MLESDGQTIHYKWNLVNKGKDTLVSYVNDVNSNQS